MSCSSQLPDASQIGQTWFLSENSRSRTNFRALTTCGDSVCISIPSDIGKVHAVIKVRCPLTSTTHIRQAPTGINAGWSQSVGMSMPACFAALRIVLPAGALTFWPFMLILTIVIVCHASFLGKFMFILTLAAISNVADTVPPNKKSLILQFDHQIKGTMLN
jgi:hypothetical protein